jgi:hypothetical protein
MHARDLVELAALVAVHAPVLARGPAAIAPSSVEQYWTASKCRLDRWCRSLKGWTVRAGASGAGPPDSRRIAGLVEEILSGEVLTRVWAAAAAAHDRHHGADLIGPAARSILVGHLEARHRVLTALVSGRGLDPEEAIRLDEVRRRAERWSDVLLASFVPFCDVCELAIDFGRAQDFADDFAYQSRQRGGRQVWPLLLASLRAAFPERLGAASPNADLNAGIAAGLLGCFPADLFDATGFLESLWLARISRITADTQGMIDELLKPRSGGGE